MPDKQQTMDAPIRLSVLVVNYNTSHLLPEFMASLMAGLVGVPAQLLFVDNASADDSVQALRTHYPQVELVVNAQNVGFGRANNQLLEHVKGHHVLLLNPDAFVEPEAIGRALDWLSQHPECGVLGGQLLGREGNLQPSCRYFPTPWNVFLMRTGLHALLPGVRLVDDMRWPHDEPRACDWVPGCFYLMRREVLQQLGLFDPRFFVYYEEVDHCQRVKAAGYSVCFFPGARVVHLGGESAKSSGQLTAGARQLSSLQVESEWLYLRKHHGQWGVGLHLALLALGDGVVLAKFALKRCLGRPAVREVAFLPVHWRVLRLTQWASVPLHRC